MTGEAWPCRMYAPEPEGGLDVPRDVKVFQPAPLPAYSMGTAEALDMVCGGQNTLNTSKGKGKGQVWVERRSCGTFLAAKSCWGDGAMTSGNPSKPPARAASGVRPLP